MSYKQLVTKQHEFEEAEPSMIDYAKAWSLKRQRRTWTLEDGIPQTGRAQSTNYWDDLLLTNTEKFLTYAAFCTRSSPKSDLDILTDAYEEMKTWLENAVYKNFANPNQITTGNQDRTEYDMSLLILTSGNVLARTITYKSAFPTFIGDIEFASTPGTLQYVSFPMTFRFSGFDFS